MARRPRAGRALRCARRVREPNGRSEARTKAQTEMQHTLEPNRPVQRDPGLCRCSARADACEFHNEPSCANAGRRVLAGSSYETVHAGDAGLAARDRSARAMVPLQIAWRRSWRSGMRKPAQKRKVEICPRVGQALSSCSWSPPSRGRAWAGHLHCCSASLPPGYECAR